jgi:hypothetical protein
MEEEEAGRKVGVAITDACSVFLLMEMICIPTELILILPW